MDTKDDTEVISMELPLDRQTIVWLLRLTCVTGDRPADIVASILHDIRVDDEHADDGPSPPLHLN